MAANGTSFEFAAGAKNANPADVLIVPLAMTPKPAMASLTRVDALCAGAASELIGVGALHDELASMAHSARSGAHRRVLLVSLGSDSELDGNKMRQAAGAAARWLMSAKVKTASLWLDGLLSADFPGAVREWVIGMGLAGFRFDELRKPDERAAPRVRVQLLSSEQPHVTRSLTEAQSALPLVDAVNYAKRLAHTPPNLFHPAAAADEARRLAKAHKLKLTLIDHEQAAKLGMNGLLAVGMAATHKPCLIRLDYFGGAPTRKPVVVIGKTVTFDTGGISIKPAAGMESMKFDKCGGCAVLGIMKAVAALKLRCNVIGILAVAENAIAGEAYRPGDIIRMYSGKTVEITNTDAEGRMVLADALCYAQKTCKPSAMIDFATLTGGMVTALGKAAAGLMSNNEALSDELSESGRRVHERLWPLPLWDEYRDLIKSSEADIKNSSAKRYAHPIVGGMFLKEFVDKSMPWAHLDIAGTATTDDERAATGFGVRLIVDYLSRNGH